MGKGGVEFLVLWSYGEKDVSVLFCSGLEVVKWRGSVMSNETTAIRGTVYRDIYLI